MVIHHHDFGFIFCSSDDGDLRWLTAGVAGYLGGTVWGVVSAL